MAIVVWRRRFLPFLFLLLLPAFFHEAVNPQPPPPKVIILNSYHPGFIWSDDELIGLLERLYQRYPGIVPAIEYLDTKNFPAEDHLLRVKDYLVSKYRGQQFDLAVALDNSALDMILRHRQELFPGVPLVFAGISDFKPSMLAGQEKVTGVAEIVSIADTLGTALALFPRTKEVLAVHDYTKSGLASQREIEALLPLFQSRVAIKSSPPATMAEIVGRIKALPVESLVLINSLATDKEGKTFSQAESTRLLTEDTKIPAFATHVNRLGYGIIGGYLLGGKDHGRRAGDMALQVLAGENPSEMPVSMESTARPMFDYQQLIRFNISPNALPAGSIIINRPQSFYDQNKSLVWGTVSVIIALCLVVFVLSMNIMRRRKAEEAWLQSEERYHNLVQNVPLGLYRSSPGPRGAIFLANPAITRIFGYKSVDELLKIHAADVYVEPTARQFLSDELISQGHVAAKELQFKKKDGTWFWGSLTANAVRNESGEIIYFDGFVEDITEKKLIVEELRTAAQKWRTTFDAISDAICLLDLECTILQCNQSLVTMIGKPYEEIIGYRCWEILHGCSQPVEGCPVVRMKQTRQPEEQLLAWCDRWITTRADPILDKEGTLIGAVHIISDITQQKRSEEALRESEEKYRLLVNQIPAVVFKGYADWSIDFFDEKVKFLTGYSKEDFNDRKVKWNEVILPEDLPAAKREFIQGLHTDQSYVREYRIRKKDGEIIWIQNLGRIFCDASGKIDTVSGVLFDITERKQAERKLNRANRALRAVSECNQALVRATDEMRFLQDVCRIIVHDCGYPLAWIGFAQQDEAKSVPPVAFEGVEGEDPEWINLTWGDDDEGRGPGGMAIKTGKTQVIRNILEDLNTIPWYEAARQRGLNSIIALPLTVAGKTIGILDILARDLEAFDEDEAKLLEELSAAVSYGIWSLRTDVQRHQAEVEARHTLEQLHRSLDGTVLALANLVESRDPYTAGHQQRVTQLACAIASEMGLSPDQIEGLRVMGYLHDIGKIAVPAEILSRPGKISENELNIVKVHPQVGYDVIKDIEFPWPIAQGILHHHERLDGSGYPLRLKGSDILKEAKILAVADVVEAMVSHRPYRAALEIDEAMEEIAGKKGVLYDPEVVEACVKLFAEKGFTFS